MVFLYGRRSAFAVVEAPAKLVRFKQRMGRSAKEKSQPRLVGFFVAWSISGQS
jgi:hypothetical protein